MATAARLRLAVKRTLQLGLAGVVVTPPATYSYWYTVNATKRQQECIRYIVNSFRIINIAHLRLKIRSTYMKLKGFSIDSLIRKLFLLHETS